MFLFITGSRLATTPLHGLFIHSVLTANYDPRGWQVIHGGARGVDLMVAEMLPWLGGLSVPANWDLYRKSAGHRRNEALVSLACTLRDLQLPVAWRAFPMGESPGTRGCAALAEECNFDVAIHELLPPA